MTLQTTTASRRSLARVAVLGNSVTPYRSFLHQRLVREVPEVELYTLSTHDNAYNRWQGATVPESIRHVPFGHGEPTNEQTQLRYSWREWRKGGRIIQWLKQHEISAVLCQGCGDFGRLRVLRWCRRNNIPCFLTGDFNVCGDKLRGPMRWLKRQTYQRAIDWSTGLMPCGRFGRELLARYGGEAKPTYWFPFVPDTTLFANASPHAVNRVCERFPFLNHERRRVVFSARLMPVKRPDLAIRAFADIAAERPDWDLVMVGDGPLRSGLEASVPPGLAERIHFTGFLHDPADMAAVYQHGDALLLPSDHEPWGVVVVEAAAAGLAIVASDVVGAAPELVVNNRNGSTFAVGDLDDLKAALLTVTAAETIDRMRCESPLVFAEWCNLADPVRGFREALSQCGVIKRPPADQPALQQSDNEVSREQSYPVSHVSVHLSGSA